MKSKRLEKLLERGAIHMMAEGESGGGSAAASVETEAEVPAETTTEPETTVVEDNQSTPEGESTEGDEGKQLSESEAKLLKETMQRKEQIKELRKELEARQAEQSAKEAELSKFKDILGDTPPEQLAELLEAKKKAETLELERKGEYDRIVERMKEESEKERQSLQARIEELSSSLASKEAQIDDMTIGRSFAESSFIREKSSLPPGIARKEFASHFELKNNVLVGYEKPVGSEGNTPIVDAEGRPKSFDDAIAELYASHPDSATLIKAVVKQGAASGTDTKPAGKSTSEQSDNEVKGIDRISRALAAKKG